MYPLHDLDIYWQHAGISLAALTSKVKVKFGNIGVSCKEVLIFKENRLSLIDRYQVFVSACKISGDFVVWLKKVQNESLPFFYHSVMDWLGKSMEKWRDLGKNLGKPPCKVVPVVCWVLFSTFPIMHCMWKNLIIIVPIVSRYFLITPIAPAVGRFPVEV